MKRFLSERVEALSVSEPEKYCFRACVSVHVSFSADILPPVAVEGLIDGLWAK